MILSPSVSRWRPTPAENPEEISSEEVSVEFVSFSAAKHYTIISELIFSRNPKPWRQTVGIKIDKKKTLLKDVKVLSGGKMLVKVLRFKFQSGSK